MKAEAKATRVSKEIEDEAPEVKAEPVSAKRPPKPSLTPVPTVAAVTAKPLAEPIGTKEKLEVSHAPEPSRTPIVVSTREPRKTKRAKPPCLHAPVDVMRGAEEQAFPLTKCDGSAAPLAVEELSVLTRPGSAAKPEAPIAELAKKGGEEIAPGIRRLDARLLERMQVVVDHFAKPGKTPRVFVVSGYRPTSKGSFHANGRAIDFRVDGVENTDLVAFCKTLPDTGCGFYPNSSFIHLDVRDSGSGKVSWIDASSPGEKPQYVAAWPPPPKADDDEDDPVKLMAKLDELQILPPPSADDEAEAEAKAAKPAVVLQKKIEIE